EHPVVLHVVVRDTVPWREGVDHGRNDFEVAEDRVHRDVHHVVAEATAIRPATGNESTVAKRVLDGAVQHITAKDAQPRELVRGIIAAGRCQVCARCGQVYLDQVGDVDRRDVGAASGDL